jgi:hypothetical protein
MTCKRLHITMSTFLKTIIFYRMRICPVLESVVIGLYAVLLNL